MTLSSGKLNLKGYWSPPCPCRLEQNITFHDGQARFQNHFQHLHFDFTFPSNAFLLLSKPSMTLCLNLSRTDLVCAFSTAQKVLVWMVKYVITLWSPKEIQCCVKHCLGYRSLSDVVLPSRRLMSSWKENTCAMIQMFVSPQNAGDRLGR